MTKLRIVHLARPAKAARSTRYGALSVLGVVAVAAATIVPIAVLSTFSTSSAGAVSTTLKFEVRGNPGSPLVDRLGYTFNAAIEPKAKVKFSCDTVNGDYTVTASNIQVIAHDGVTPWDFTDGDVSGKYYLLLDIVHGNIATTFQASLTQQPTGLFGTSTTGVLVFPAYCATGNEVAVAGFTTAERTTTPAYEYGVQGTL